MLEKQSLIVENTLKAEEAKVRTQDTKEIYCSMMIIRRGSSKR